MARKKKSTKKRPRERRQDLASPFFPGGWFKVTLKKGTTLSLSIQKIQNMWSQSWGKVCWSLRSKEFINFLAPTPMQRQYLRTDRQTLLLTLWLISASEYPRCDVIWRASCASSSNVTQQGVEGYRYRSYPMSPVRYLSPHCLSWRKSTAHEIETNSSLPRSCNSFLVK